ncbi:hypothetical protein HXX76_008884 [Chlamydomonas incerta]|uniref:Uncharacterized protein n=1 Tax=Chlamydomonas incerta TaxID=51695 RepID=A0A835W0J2_CHLIN|nr:hypothetical protein HXX76_008884 [Chlamydomonas incerta]|eukprot:KAG2432539.1 hypothetical protein HXX76_008884 [Chlamydomonas incerta]
MFARLLMPVIALILMIIPLVGLCLPVYLTSAQQREAERDSQSFVCQLYTQNNPSPRATNAINTFNFTDDVPLGVPLYGAYLAWAYVEAVADAAPNSTEAQAAVDELRKNFTASEPAYFAELQQNCSVVGEYVWGGKRLTAKRRSGSNALPQVDADVAPAMRYFVERHRKPLNPSLDEETGEYVEPDEYGIALLGVINSTLVNLDVNSNAATLSFELRALSYHIDTPMVDDRGRIFAPNVSIKADVVSASGPGDLTMKTGDRVASRPINTVLTPIRGVYYYPFDEYTIDVRIQSIMSGRTGRRQPLAVIVSQRNQVTGWLQEVTMITNVLENYNMWWVADPDNVDSDVVVGYTIRVQRSNFVKFFACLVLIVMWTLTAAAITYAVDLNFLRPRNAMMMECTMMITLLFAMGNIRNVMPGIPGIGIGIDQYGYIWIMILLMAAATTMLGKLICQYVHPLPTLYDRVVKNECYTEWRKKEDDKAKKAKEEAEKKKEEEEKKKEEEEKKKQKEAEAMKLQEGRFSGSTSSCDEAKGTGSGGSLSTPRAQVTRAEGSVPAAASVRLPNSVSVRKQGDGGMDMVCAGVI